MIFFTVSNLANFVVTFTLPYLLTEPAWLGSKVGFIFGSIAAVGLIWGVFFMPELSNKTLEDIDEMFEANIPAWRTRRKFVLDMLVMKLDANVGKQIGRLLAVLRRLARWRMSRLRASRIRRRRRLLMSA